MNELKKPESGNVNLETKWNGLSETILLAELLTEIQSFTPKYQFSFQFWGEGNNNVFLNKDDVELYSAGGRDTIAEVLQDTLIYLYKINRIKKKVPQLSQPAPIQAKEEWIKVDDRTPIAFKSGNYDGLQSDLVLTWSEKEGYKIARVYEGTLDGNHFKDWYDERDFDINKPTYWKELSNPISPTQSEGEIEKEITRLQEKYDENGYDSPSLIKLRRMEQHIDASFLIYSNEIDRLNLIIQKQGEIQEREVIEAAAKECAKRYYHYPLSRNYSEAVEIFKAGAEWIASHHPKEQSAEGEEAAEEVFEEFVCEIVRHFNGTEEQNIRFADVEIYIPELIKQLKSKYKIEYKTNSKPKEAAGVWVKASERLPEKDAGHYACRITNDNGYDYGEMYHETAGGNNNVAISGKWLEPRELTQIEWLDEQNQ